MLFLLPPSESKRIGGKPLNIQDVALTFGALNPARTEVMNTLLEICSDRDAAARALKLTPKQHTMIDVNLAVNEAPIMPALMRYTGTLYDALVGDGLNATEMLRAKQQVLIQSALFGLIPSTDLIPNYRMSASTNLPSIKLRELWSTAHLLVWPRLTGLIIDLRSKSYVALAPIPAGIQSYYVDVVVELADGTRRPLNHFNKKSKGLFVRAMLQAAEPPMTMDDLRRIAETANLGFEVSGSTITLVSPGLV